MTEKRILVMTNPHDAKLDLKKKLDEEKVLRPERFKEEKRLITADEMLIKMREAADTAEKSGVGTGGKGSPED